MRAMPNWVRYSLLPAAIALSALFIVLPRTGADTTIKFLGRDPNFRLQPTTLHVEPGARLSFENDTRTTHTATCGSCETDAWDTGDIQPGATVFLTFDEPASFIFVCRYHTNLIGQLVVGTPQASSSASPSVSAS
jgi:plastocyanin